MATFNIGHASVIALFSPTESLSERKSVCRTFEDADSTPNDSPETIALAQQFASQCDFGLKRLLAEKKSVLKTLRIENGYGWPEYNKNWLRLGCELMVEEEELDEALAFLETPMNAALFEVKLEVATKEFIALSLRRSAFTEVSSSFHLLQNPELA